MSEKNIVVALDIIDDITSKTIFNSFGTIQQINSTKTMCYQ